MACRMSTKAGSTNDGPQWYRTEVTAIEGGRFVPIHEEHFALCDRSTTLPHRQWTALPIMCERRAYRDVVDADGRVRFGILTGHEGQGRA
jgi:hypothetical protein